VLLATLITEGAAVCNHVSSFAYTSTHLRRLQGQLSSCWRCRLHRVRR